MSTWEYRSVPFKFQFSDWTLFSLSTPLQVRAYRLADEVVPVEQPLLPTEALENGSQGFSIRSLPVIGAQPKISYLDGFIRYIPLQYQHYYIDLKMTFAEYQKTFSSKTRSTINRKVKKYAKACGGEIEWKAYKTAQEMEEFFPLAREVSQKTYQEKLLDAGLPEGDEFLSGIRTLANQDNVRAYILFMAGKPISYLCCPARDGVLVYSYQGYDPEYMHLSVGTVLQWLALEEIFAEGKFRIFDFTEGQSQHKRLFATDELQCANVIFLKNSLRNKMLVRVHMLANGVSETAGNLLERWGFKAKIKKLLRFGR